MRNREYEPFGEQMPVQDAPAAPSRTSDYLSKSGIWVFWTLVGTIVLARGVFFDPDTFNQFRKVAALMTSYIF